LKPGGLFLSCREHVVSNATELQRFLESHPVHQLTGGENAFPLKRYCQAIRMAGLKLIGVIAPWNSVINAFPAVQSDAEIERSLKRMLGRRWGIFGQFLSRFAIARGVLRWRLNHRGPGRLYSFLAEKGTDN